MAKNEDMENGYKDEDVVVTTPTQLTILTAPKAAFKTYGQFAVCFASDSTAIWLRQLWHLLAGIVSG